MGTWQTILTCPVDGYGKISFNTSSLSPYAFIIKTLGTHITLYFDGNGGKGYKSPIKTLPQTQIRLPENPYERLGHTFAGWLVDGESSVREAGSLYPATKDVFIRALWSESPTPTEKYSVTYKAGDGIGEDYVVTNLEKGVAHPLVYFRTTNFVAPTGKVFDKWALGSSSGTKYQEAHSYIVNENTIFVATYKDQEESKWKDNAKASWEEANAEGWLGSDSTITGFSGSMYVSSTYNIPQKINNTTITQIASSAFSGNNSVAEIGGFGIESVGYEAFFACSNLTTVSLPNCTTIGSSAFRNNKSITSFYAPNVVKIEENGCRNLDGLTSVSFPNCEYIGSGAFSTCDNLQVLSFPKCSYLGYTAFALATNASIANFASCKTIGSYAFVSSPILKTISFPVCETVGSFAFQNCSYIESVLMPACKIVKNNAFLNCYRISYVSLPVCSTIEGMAFYMDQYICEVRLPQCQIIKGNAFEKTYNLSTVSLPMCNFLSHQAFYMCSALTTVYLLSDSMVSTDGTPFFNCDNLLSIYVPSSLVDTYKSASNWSVYSSQFVAYTE